MSFLGVVTTIVEVIILLYIRVLASGRAGIALVPDPSLSIYIYLTPA